MMCGLPTKAGTPCRQPGPAPCGFHADGTPIAHAGQAALQAQRAASAGIVVSLGTRQGVERTLQSVAVALAKGLIGDKRANVIVRACAERIRMLDLRLQEREEALERLERSA